ncbi:MAG: AsmA family protein [Bacteroidia bacterium]|nr:AsmA family protein [Bacteroidia bacterium]
MKFLKRFAVFSISCVSIALISGMILGYVFRDKIHLMVVQELEKALDADIELGGTDVSFIKSFPRVAIDLDRLQLNPKEYTAESPFISIEQATFKVDIMSFFSDQYEVLGISLDQPTVFLQRDKKGLWNYGNLFKAKHKDADEAPSKVELALRNGQLFKGKFTYSDLKNNDFIEIEDIDLDLSGRMEDQLANLDLKGGLLMKTLNTGGTVYLEGQKLGLVSKVEIDAAEQLKLTFTNGEITAKTLSIGINGKLEEQNKGDFFMDFAFASNRNSFDSFLSVLPGGLLDTGREYEYTGEFKLEGYVRGVSSKNSDPEVFAEYSVKDGSFRYTDFETRLTDVNLNGNFLWNSKKEAASGIHIEKMTAKLNDHALSGKMNYTNFNKGNLDFALKGDLDLHDFQEFYPKFAPETELKGQIKLDLNGKGTTDDFRKGNYNKFKAEGSLGLNQVTVVEKHLKYPLQGLSGQVSLNNNRAEVASLKGKIGDSDFGVKGIFTSYLPYFFDSTGTLTAILDLNSNHLDINQLLKEDETAGGENAKETYKLELPQRLDFTLAANVADFRLQNLEAKNLKGKVHLTPGEVTLDGLSFDAFGGSSALSGRLVAVSDKELNAVMKVYWDNLDVNKTLHTFGQLGDFTLLDDKMYGTTSGNVDLKGTINNLLELNEPTLEAKGHVAVKDGRLLDYEPLNSLAGFVKLDKLRDARFSDVQTDFQISKAHFIVPDMELTAMDFNLKVRGSHGFDQTLDYYLKIEMPKLLARKSTNPRIAEYINEDEGTDLKVILPIRIKGTVDDPSFALDGNHVRNAIAAGVVKEKEEVKAGFKNEVETLFGEQDTNKVEDWIEVEQEGENGGTNLKNLFQNFKNPFKRKPRVDTP